MTILPDVGLAGAVGTSWTQRVSRPGAITVSSPAQGAVRCHRIGQRQRGPRCGGDGGVAGVSPLEGVTENVIDGRRQGKAFPSRESGNDERGGKLSDGGAAMRPQQNEKALPWPIDRLFSHAPEFSASWPISRYICAPLSS